MSEKDDNLTTRRTPAKSDEDWMHIWDGAHKSRQMWIVVGPFVAIVKNWPALIGILGSLLWANQDGLFSLLRGISGAWQ